MRLLFALLLSVAALAAQDDVLSDAIGALQRGDPAAAEQTLRTHLRSHPDDAEALDVLGVVLDQQKKFAEADTVYRRATTLDPRSPGLLNNYGNHLIASGHLKEARPVFLKVLALNPAQANAAVQLARIALEEKAPAEAMRRLDTLPQQIKDRPDVALLIMRAEYALGRTSEADAILSRLSSAPQADARQLGAALAAAGRYDQAEAVFSHALEAAPGNFEMLYDLGLAASHAGHNERAREVLESALRQQPENVDVLYDLAAVDATLKHNEDALRLLARAARLAPDRVDVLRLLARTTADLGYFADAIEAWNRYLKLVPADAAARRERAFAETAVGNNMKAGLDELRSFVASHPKDAAGYYELGVAESAGSPADALACFNRALAVKPDLVAAHIARGLLNYRQGNLAAALPDFQYAAKVDPHNPVVLDRLGETWLGLDRPADAVPLLRKAAELAPNDSKVIIHLARALSATGQTDEAKAEFQRFRELGPDRSTLAHPAGLVDFLSLSPEEQLARYRAGVERTVKADPRNAEAQVRRLQLLLADGKMADAAAAAKQIAALNPGPTLLAEAASALLNAEQYAAAKDLLDDAGAASPELILDLAIARFHLDGADAGLSELDRIPTGQRTGDYYLAKADMLNSAGRPAETSAAIEQALRMNPKRPDLYRHAALLLIREDHPADAIPLLRRAVAVLPDDADILLLSAAALELAGKTPDAEKVLRTIENRWPEWPNAWVVHALVLDLHQQYDRARSHIDTAIALGADNRDIRALADGNAKAASDEARLRQLLLAEVSAH